MIEVFILDDHPVVREGVERILEEEPDIYIAGQAGTWLELRELLESMTPDVIILDVTMPDRSGLEVLMDLKAEHPEVPVLIMSVHDEKHYATRSIRAGAAGYLNKMSITDELVGAIRCVVSGRRYVSLQLAEELAEELNGSHGATPHEALSEREFQVMRMIATGLKLRQIAEELDISPKTVSTCRERLLDKMGMCTNAELTNYAVRNNLIA
jgi:DNA-binding NarL/FixJ family response regulator